MGEKTRVINTVILPGELKGKQRVRITKKGHAYTPEQTVLAENWVRVCYLEQVGLCRVVMGAVRLTLNIELAIPVSWPRAKQAQALSGEILPTGKPDVDNCAKLVCDALNGIAWRDDSQVVELHVTKHYGARAQSVLHIEEI